MIYQFGTGGGVEGTYIELGFNFIPRLFLFLDDVLPYGSGEPPRVLRRHTREHVESFTLGMYRLRVRKPLKLFVKVFNNLGANICVMVVSNLVNERRGRVHGGSHPPSSPGMDLSPNLESILSA